MTIFLNGGSPDFLGAKFSTASELTNLVESTLLSAGWTTNEKSPDGFTLLMTGTTVNGHNCFVEFKSSTKDSTSNYLTIRGFHSSARLNPSPDATHRLVYATTQANRLYLTADNDSGCISITAFGDQQGGIHFGFLDRIDNTDQWAWMVGFIYSDGYRYAYPAKSKVNGTAWRQLILDFFNFGDENQNTMPLTCVDFTMRGICYSSHNWSDGRNPFYNLYAGRRNYTGNPILDSYCYQEGRGDNGGYGWSAANPRETLFYRGLVKNAYCGVSYENGGIIFYDPTRNIRVLSVGGQRWQGLRIS